MMTTWIIWKQENTLLGYDLLLTKKLKDEKNVSCFICDDFFSCIFTGKRS